MLSKFLTDWQVWEKSLGLDRLLWSLQMIFQTYSGNPYRRNSSCLVRPRRDSRCLSYAASRKVPLFFCWEKSPREDAPKPQSHDWKNGTLVCGLYSAYSKLCSPAPSPTHTHTLQFHLRPHTDNHFSNPGKYSRSIYSFHRWVLKNLFCTRHCDWQWTPNTIGESDNKQVANQYFL